MATTLSHHLLQDYINLDIKYKPESLYLTVEQHEAIYIHVLVLQWIMTLVVVFLSSF